MRLERKLADYDTYMKLGNFVVQTVIHRDSLVIPNTELTYNYVKEVKRYSLTGKHLRKELLI